MVVDSRQKGARGETVVRDMLRKATNLKWERIPMSGGLSPVHQLKGDLYVPNSLNIFCVEVKHYKDDHLTSKVLTDKTPQILEWWKQTIRESAQISRKPLLIYKFDRSKVFVAFKDMPNYTNYRWVYFNIDGHEFYSAKLDDWLNYEQPKFV